MSGSCRRVSRTYPKSVQVSWSLTQECRSPSSVDHRGRQLGCISEKKSYVSGAFPVNPGVPASVPHQKYDTSTGIATSGGDSQGGRGDATGANNDDSNTKTEDSHNTDSSGGIRRDTSSSNNFVEDPSANGDGADGKLASSSWQLRRHFPPNALIPRAPPTCIFPGASAAANQVAAHATSAQTSSIASRRIVLQAEKSAAGPGAPHLADAPMIRPRTSGSKPLPTTATTNKTPKRPRVRRRPHTVSTGLHDLGLSWGGAENTSFETRHGGVSPVPRHGTKATGPGAAAADAEESDAATPQYGNGDDLDASTRTPRGTQADWRAPRRQADGGVVVGLTAEVIKSPGISLDRSGRVVVGDKVTLSLRRIVGGRSCDIFPRREVAFVPVLRTQYPRTKVANLRSAC